jgi:ribosomal protein L11 methylase PrmA
MKTRNSSNVEKDPASFRDPSGFVFWKGGTLYRQVNTLYEDHYRKLMDGGLYADLVKHRQLLAHDEVEFAFDQHPGAYRVIEPQRVRFISYPYEWSFSQLKDAALLTLTLQRKALYHGMTLKDASAYNVQFLDGKPVLMDTLSFETYVEGQAWVAYRQFCQHFLAPLLLMAQGDVRLGQFLRLYIDGIPLDIASKLLPKRSYAQLGTLMHIHLHARAQQRYSGARATQPTRPLQKSALLNIIDSLTQTINGLKPHLDTAWMDYYQGDSYIDEGLAHKKRVVDQFITTANPAVVWDMGANTGVFSRLASAKDISTVAWDIDAGAVELNYRQVKQNNETNLLPLIVDLTNPSPGLGWANEERRSLSERANADLLLVLALVHHLAIVNNVPLARIAAFFAQLAPALIIEFVPKSDAKVKELLASRADIFPNYTQDGFEAAFRTVYDIIESHPIPQSERTLYLMRRG